MQSLGGLFSPIPLSLLPDPIPPVLLPCRQAQRFTPSLLLPGSLRWWLDFSTLGVWLSHPCVIGTLLRAWPAVGAPGKERT